MSFAIPPKTKLTLQDAKSEPWEDKYPNKCPLWLNIIGWSFVCVPFFFN
ncbi:Whole genome shotgun sequence [Vibrio jasicida]|nr:Whole genome shotgun sequence [Vibrio jasicida]